MVEEKIERIYTIPLGKAYEHTRTKRTPRAVKLLRQYVSQHMKSDDVLLSNRLNNLIWERSIQRPPRKVKVRVIKSDGKVKVYLPDEMSDDEIKAKKEKEVKERAEKLKKEMEEKKKKEKPKEAKPETTTTKQETPKPEAPKPEAKEAELKKEKEEKK